MNIDFLYIARSILSLCIVSASLGFVIYGILIGQHRLGLPTTVHFVLLGMAIAFLAYFESGQVAIVNLSSIEPKQSKKIESTHPRAYEVYSVISNPGVVERYLMGRQLCVIGIVFFISQLTTFHTLPPVLPDVLENLLIRTGLPGKYTLRVTSHFVNCTIIAGVMITLTIGQLFPQLMADEYTIRFLNMRGTLLFVKIASVFESIGIFTHFSWITSHVLINHVFRWKEKPEVLTNNPVDTLDISRSTHALIWGSTSSLPSSSSHSMEVEVSSVTSDLPLSNSVPVEQIEDASPVNGGTVTSFPTLVKLLVSTFLTLSAAAIVIYGILFASPLLKLHPLLLLLILTVCVITEFYLEGTQVAILAAQRRDINSIPDHLSNAKCVLEIASSDRKVVKKFLIGRQFLIVMSMFTMASITTYQNYDDYEQSIVPKRLFGTFVLTGFCGVLFALNTVQLPAQIIAQQYPIRFLNFPGIVFLVRASLAVECTGIMHFGWILFDIIGKLIYHTGE